MGAIKRFFDATKVTYNKYSCAIIGMSREMMKMDGQDRAEFQIWEKRDITVIFGKVFKSLDDKTATVLSLTSLKRPKNVI